MRDKIRIRGLRVDCVIGVLPEERTREQPVILDVELTLDVSSAAYTGRIDRTVDYDRAAQEIDALLRFRRYQLLEMAAEELCAMLIGVHPSIEHVVLEIQKPRALLGRAASVGVEVSRGRADFPSARDKPEFGEVEIIHESSAAGLYLLHIDPGKRIPTHYHAVMRELEWLVAGEVERDGRRLGGFSPVAWPQGQRHTYVNVGTGRATLFCCDSPPFIPEDEVVVQPDDRDRALERGR